MSHEREECRCCGKHMGLDDLVHNAKYGCVHSSVFYTECSSDWPKEKKRPARVTFCSPYTPQLERNLWWMESPTIWKC
jgi:hypothetical protein